MNAKRRLLSRRRRKSGRTDDVIRHYEAMSATDIEAELLLAGIDPRPTIDAVTELVNQRLEEWRLRGVLHGEKTVERVAA
jgi:hypothetical protein